MFLFIFVYLFYIWSQFALPPLFPVHPLTSTSLLFLFRKGQVFPEDQRNMAYKSCSKTKHLPLY